MSRNQIFLYYGKAAVCLIAFSGTSSAIHADPSERCAEALVRVGRPVVATLAASGSQVRVGRKVVRLAAQIENDEHVDSKSLIGLHVDLFVDDVRQPLTYGSLGIGKDREDAINTAVSEWAMAVGEPLLRALGAKTGEQPEQIGQFLIYRGPAGIRGSDHVAWSSEKDKKLLHHLDAFVHGLEHSPGELHSISLMIAVRPDGKTEGECRIDGAISTSLLKAVQSFSWRQDGLNYLFKEFYVVRRQ